MECRYAVAAFVAVVVVAVTGVGVVVVAVAVAKRNKGGCINCALDERTADVNMRLMALLSPTKSAQLFSEAVNEKRCNGGSLALAPSGTNSR